MVTAASEDAFRDPVDQADLEDWAAYFGLSFPVLQDPGAMTDRIYDPAARSRPTYVLIGPGAEILATGNISTGQIEAALPTPYP